MENAIQSRLGFTLIELLVVVLIIGILSAVALPQYQKAVEKSRLTEALQMVSNFQKGVEALCLADPNFSGNIIGCPGDSADGKCRAIDIDIENTLTCKDGPCSSKHFEYGAGGACNGDMHIELYRCDNGDSKQGTKYQYSLYVQRNSNGQWTKECDPYDKSSSSLSICQSLAAQGWNGN